MEKSTIFIKYVTNGVERFEPHYGTLADWYSKVTEYILVDDVLSVTESTGTYNAEDDYVNRLLLNAQSNLNGVKGCEESVRSLFIAPWIFEFYSETDEGIERIDPRIRGDFIEYYADNYGECSHLVSEVGIDIYGNKVNITHSDSGCFTVTNLDRWWADNLEDVLRSNIKYQSYEVYANVVNLISDSGVYDPQYSEECENEFKKLVRGDTIVSFIESALSNAMNSQSREYIDQLIKSILHAAPRQAFKSAESDESTFDKRGD